MYQAFRKQALPAAAEPASTPLSYAAPTGGWVSAKSPAGKSPLVTYGPTAEKLEGFFPTTTGIEIMGGSQKHATVSESGEPCESLFVYRGGGVEKMFGAADGSVFDITTVADEDAEPTADITGQTSDYYSSFNFSTAGGAFLYIVNGSDKPQLYGGSSWTAIDSGSVPAITGVTTSSLSHVNGYRYRLYFVEVDSLNVWALPVGSLGGAAIKLSMAGVFQKGGSVLFTATWSQDSGDGLDDTLVVVSTEGECAIYSGSDPSDANDFAIQGLYSLPKPLGKNAYRREGGELLILTEQGEYPISAAVRVDKDQMPQYAYSRFIEPDWLTEAGQRKGLPWEVVSWPNKQREVISVPVTGDVSVTPPLCFVRNTTTGAWCSRPGWNTRCLVFFNDFVYFGTNSGTVIQMETSGSDDGANYYPVCVLAWDQAKAPGYQKTVLSARAIFKVSQSIVPKLSASTDYAIDLPTAPNAAPDVDAPGEWDVGLWDVAKWDTGTSLFIARTSWESVNLGGLAIAPQIQLTIGNVTAPRGELIQIDTLIEYGQLML